MPDRDSLNRKLDELRASLARAAKTMPLSQPTRSTDLYSEVERNIDILTAWVDGQCRAAGGNPPRRSA